MFSLDKGKVVYRVSLSILYTDKLVAEIFTFYYLSCRARSFQPQTLVWIFLSCMPDFCLCARSNYWYFCKNFVRGLACNHYKSLYLCTCYNSFPYFLFTNLDHYGQFVFRSTYYAFSSFLLFSIHSCSPSLNSHSPASFFRSLSHLLCWLPHFIFYFLFDGRIISLVS